MNHPFTPSLQKLDDLLLDLATLLSLTEQDRKIAESRYRRLKSYLTREECEFALLLENENSLIYAQGSMATSTTIISGCDGDRFDVDAVIEITVPPTWSHKEVLDKLYVALSGFPHAKKIERCTRCVQIQFANMHMDVTILDNSQQVSGKRPGEIFHSPDDTEAYKVPSNPWGFTDWFRTSLFQDQNKFREITEKKRQIIQSSKLLQINDEEMIYLKEAEQEDLAPIIPAHLDSQESIALKLLKRFVNLQYENSKTKRPPSIYLTKKAIDCGYSTNGLATQLYTLADHISKSLQAHVDNSSRPDERNPSYKPDVITDRWPRPYKDGEEDLNVAIEKMEFLKAQLVAVEFMQLREAKKVFSELFGERITEKMLHFLVEASDPSLGNLQISHITPVGNVIASQPSVQTNSSPSTKSHRFHCSNIKGFK